MNLVERFVAKLTTSYPPRHLHSVPELIAAIKIYPKANSQAPTHGQTPHDALGSK